MKRLIFSAFILALLAGSAYADLYQWKDKGGKVHITDSMEKVPSEYRGSVSVFKSGEKEGAAPAPEEGGQADGVTAPVEAVDQAQELYGEQTLDWWAQSLQKKRAEVNGLQASVDAKSSFVEVFEAGRRFGQLFDSKDVAKYNAFKKELPSEVKTLAALKEEYVSLQEKAARVGVPKHLIED